MKSAVVDAARARADGATLGADVDANDGKSTFGGNCVGGAALADGRAVDEAAAAAAVAAALRSLASRACLAANLENQHQRA